MGSNREAYARYAWMTLGYNLFVILWGAFVRATGSGAGCGSHWPLCNGEVVPRAPATATIIEFGHRATSGIALLLVVWLAAGAWRRFPRRHPVRLGAALAGVLMLTEALIGAGLVLLELVAENASVARGFWVAGHLVNTFLLLAALTLTAWWASGGAPVAPRQSRHGALLGAALAGVLLLGVSGAVTALGDTLFPVATLAEGKAQTFSETAHLFVRLRVWHPALSLLVGAYLVVVAAVVRGAKDQAAPVHRPLVLYALRLTTAMLALFGVQLGVGVANVWWLAPVAIQLVHLLLSDLIWILLVLLAAERLAVPSTLGAAAKFSMRSAAAELRGR